MSTAPTSRERAHEFLREHPLGVLSTVSQGKPWGAAIFFVADDFFNIYFITRADTQKYKNIEKHPHVALTVADGKTQTTVQIAGAVTRVSPDKYHDVVFRKLASLRPKGDLNWAPPVIKVHKGDYMVLKLEPDYLQYADFSQQKTDVHSDYIEVLIDTKE